MGNVVFILNSMWFNISKSNTYGCSPSQLISVWSHVVLGGDTGQPNGASTTEEQSAAGGEQTASATSGEFGKVSRLFSTLCTDQRFWHFKPSSDKINTTVTNCVSQSLKGFLTTLIISMSCVSQPLHQLQNKASRYIYLIMSFSYVFWRHNHLNDMSQCTV